MRVLARRQRVSKNALAQTALDVKSFWGLRLARDRCRLPLSALLPLPPLLPPPLPPPLLLPYPLSLSHYVFNTAATTATTADG